MKKQLSLFLFAFAASCPLHASLNATQPPPLPDLSDEVAGVKQQLVSFFEDVQQAYEEGTQELDSAKVDDALDLLQTAEETNLFGAAKLVVSQNSPIEKKVAMQKIRSYKETKEDFNKKVDVLQKKITAQGLLPAADSEFERKQYYQALGNQLAFIKQVDGSAHTMHNDCAKKVIGTLKTQLQKKTCEITLKIKEGDWEADAENKRLERKTLPPINAHQLALASISQHLDIEEIKVDTQLLEVQQEVQNKVTAILDADETDRPAALAEALIVAKIVGSNLETEQEELDEKIDLRLKAFEKKNEKNTELLAQLGQKLKNDETGIGNNIIQDYPTLEAYKVEAFRKEMVAYDVAHILTEFLVKNPSANETHKKKLRKHYDNFRMQYEALVLDGLTNKGGNKAAVTKIFSKVRSLISNEVQDSEEMIKWDHTTREEIVPEVLAHIFAVWTLQKSALHRKHASKENKNNFSKFLSQPHAAQIIAIFQLLGVGQAGGSKPLPSHFAEIGTGEGKSLIAAGTACLLALLGFEVDSACYSCHLVERDYAGFEPLFNAFGVTKYIHYQTFQKLCENMINEDVNVREAAKNLILPKDNDDEKAPDHGHAPPKKRHRILFVDEVDVFLNSLYGNYYAPVSSLRMTEIEGLIRYIWQKRKGIRMSQLTTSTPYQACYAQMKEWGPLLEEACKDIIHAFATADALQESERYVVQEDRIGYKEDDTISFNINYGYRTLALYFLENEQKNISDASLKKNIALFIKLGIFSYAEILKKYSRMLGVTGTLASLSKKQKCIARRIYKIQRNTFMPSLYGESRFKFSPQKDIKIVHKSEYYQALVAEINKKLTGKAYTRVEQNEEDDEKEQEYVEEIEERAVLVAFEDEKALNDFYESKEYLAYKEKTQKLTEKLNSNERKARIARAAKRGRVTFMVAAYVRGTDIPCYDKIVKSNGGMHIILTYFPKECSQQEQAFGRVARQSDEGSASFCLKLDDLQFLKVTEMAQIKKMIDNENCYETLNQRRNNAFDVSYEAKTKHVGALAEEHKKALALKEALGKGDKGTALKYLRAYNMGAAEGHKVRGVVAIDATGSMGATLQKAKDAVLKTFTSIRAVLAYKKKPVDNFELQFAFYRNYDCDEERLLVTSRWDSNPHNLLKDIEGVGANYGYGCREAVEVGLSHALRQHQKEALQFVLLIGDAAPNTADEIKSKRTYLKESYWKTTKLFKEQPHADTLFPTLRDYGVKVHAFYTVNSNEKGGVKKEFEKIAEGTAGSSGFFNDNAKDGAKQLTDILSQAVLAAIGGGDLAKAYSNKFGGKTYIS